MSFASRFCITLIATLLLALFSKSPSDSPEYKDDVSDHTASSARLIETDSVKKQRSEGPPALAPL
jgi:hypothetical protein